ncbi:MAG TPA: hypothetical protein VGV93_09300 [Acidimicrobiales bacterium]|nr:hypothetical protein [Acidimicrobiales bacterium]
MSRSLGGMVAAVVVVVGVVLLREQTMTRHQPGVPGTATEVIVSAATRNAEPASTVTELTQALVSTCRLEVDAEPISELERLSSKDRRYRLVLAPALDEFDERQLHGCLEDARINHLQLKVTRLRAISSGR